MSGKLAGDGQFTRLCSRNLEARCGSGRILLTHSCTAALEMAAILFDLGPGDEVVVPSFTFVSTVNAFMLRGARPAFVDIREDTLNIDERKIESATNDRTKAIFPVHYAGVGAEMDAILSIARSRGLFVAEDAAHGLGATYRGRTLGSMGDVGTFSFHETKNYISGEGGALLVNNLDLFARAEIVREKGTNRSAFFRGQVDKYTWVDVGSSYLPSELIAAFLYAQLELSDEIDRRRRAIHARYAAELGQLAERGVARLPYCPDHCVHTAHMFYLIAADLDERTRLIEALAAKGVTAVFHYVPLHDSPMGRKLGYARGDLPVTENVSDRLVRLPLYFDMTEAEQTLTIDAVKEFYG